MYHHPIVALDDWIALLSISTRYVFDKIRELAITEISQQLLDPVKKIALANKYNIPHWLPLAFADLIKRPEPMNDLEAESLGLRNVVRVARAREVTREKGYVVSTLRSYYPYDKIYTFNDKGIMQVFDDVWPECAGIGEPTCKLGTSRPLVVEFGRCSESAQPWHSFIPSTVPFLFSATTQGLHTHYTHHLRTVPVLLCEFACATAASASFYSMDVFCRSLLAWVASAVLAVSAVEVPGDIC